ncbi:MAG TPA: ABC transporter permease [Clostridia bacterium]|nr:ABC transporter permease [Clostridia bacterium]
MLWKKMWRDLSQNKGTSGACIVIIILALMLFTSMSLVSDTLKSSRDRFYAAQNFAAGFIQVQALPFAEIEALRQIEGIGDIQGRIVKDVRVLAPARGDNVYLRLVSLDLEQERLINGASLLQGAPLNGQQPNVWLDNMFFAAHGLALNDEIEVVAGGSKKVLQVVGVAQSPEFIYALRTAADMFPRPEEFGIAFVPLEVMKALFPGEKAFNDLVFTLEPGVEFDDVKDSLEYHLKPYGLTALYPRQDQVSHLLLQGELDGLEAMATALPVMILLIAAVILYIVLTRLTEQQRGQIGTLMALGYTRREILYHYLSYALVVGVSGGIAGAILGGLLYYPMVALYRQFFNMPIEPGSFTVHYLIFGLILTLVLSLAGGYQGCKKVLALAPAKAMRPPAPPAGRKVLLEKIKPVWEMFTVQGMMAVRNVFRNKGRSAFVFAGIMLCFAISSFTWSMNDLFQKMLFDQYEIVEVYDVKVTFARPVDAKGAARELESFPGVSLVEALAEVPVTLQNQWHKLDTVLLGLPAGSRLYNIVDKNSNKVSPPKTGILLSERLAKQLEAGTGTMLTVESPLLKSGEAKELEVVGIIPQYVGMNGYMELGAVQDFLGQGPVATAMMVSIEEASVPAFQEKYMQSHVVAGLDHKEQRLGKLKDMMDSYGSMIYIYMVIGVIIGFAIIYSSSVITVAERSRELASMMVLGMTPKEVLSVITFEQWFVGIPAMVAGIPLAKGMLSGMSQAVSSDVFTIPVVLTFSSYLLGCIVTCLSIWLAQRGAAKKIEGLSLVEVLKSVE